MKKLQIGNLILAARNEKGLTREALAENINVASTTVYRWEKNLLAPGFDMVVKLSQVLNKPLTYFAGREFESNAAHLTATENPFEVVSLVISKMATLSDKNREFILKSIEQMILGQEIAAKKKNSKEA
jgi:transcriptional regulator with XRE-family HTH domain